MGMSFVVFSQLELLFFLCSGYSLLLLCCVGLAEDRAGPSASCVDNSLYKEYSGSISAVHIVYIFYKGDQAIHQDDE